MAKKSINPFIRKLKTKKNLILHPRAKLFKTNRMIYTNLLIEFMSSKISIIFLEIPLCGFFL